MQTKVLNKTVLRFNDFGLSFDVPLQFFVRVFSIFNYDVGFSGIGVTCVGAQVGTEC